MELTLDFRPSRSDRAQQVSLELIELTRRFSNYAHTIPHHRQNPATARRVPSGAASSSSSASASRTTTTTTTTPTNAGPWNHDLASILPHLSPDLTFQTNRKNLPNLQQYLEWHHRILATHENLRFNIWDLRAEVNEARTHGKVWLTADITNYGRQNEDGAGPPERMECSLVYDWRWQRIAATGAGAGAGGNGNGTGPAAGAARWVCCRISGLTSMGAFSHDLA